MCRLEEQSVRAEDSERRRRNRSRRPRRRSSRPLSGREPPACAPSNAVALLDHPVDHLRLDPGDRRTASRPGRGHPSRTGSRCPGRRAPRRRSRSGGCSAASAVHDGVEEHPAQQLAGRAGRGGPPRPARPAGRRGPTARSGTARTRRRARSRTSPPGGARPRRRRPGGRSRWWISAGLPTRLPRKCRGHLAPCSDRCGWTSTGSPARLRPAHSTSRLASSSSSSGRVAISAPTMPRSPTARRSS